LKELKFGLEFVPRELYWKTTYYAIQAEKGQFDYIWITDHFNNRNVYVALSIILTYTDRIRVGTGVTNPFTANPAITASAIASLNEIGPGRVVCGIGAGDKTTLEQIGLKINKPLTAIKEAVKIMRTLLNGQACTFSGEIFNIPAAKLNFKARSLIPIYIGAQGRKMLSLAAEIGDGILINASHPSDIVKAMDSIKDGMGKAGKTLDSIEIAAYTAFSVHEEAEKAIKAAIPVVAFIVAGSPDQILERHDINLEEGSKIRNSLIKGKISEAFSYVTPEMVEAFSIAGDPSACIEKIATIFKLGVTQFVAGSPLGPNMRKAISILSSKILPYFKEGF
jgi:5,10-methylenetetrahydromethanopterin reductase